MEKRLRSSLQSSAEEFLNSATKQTLKSSKQKLKTLIHSTTAQNLTNCLPQSLYNSVSHAILCLQNQTDLDTANSPPIKRLRRSSRTKSTSVQESVNGSGNNTADKKHKMLEDLKIYTHIITVCLSHPKHVFSSSDLLLAAQLLHDNLILFESHLVLSLEIASLCETWWKDDLVGKELLITQFLPFLVSRSLTLKKKVDVHKVYSLRDAFSLFDFDDESIEDLKLLLIRCVISPLYLKTEDGRKFLAFVFGLSRQVFKEALAMIKSQIPFGRKSMLEAYGDVLFRAWKGVDEDFREEIEDGFLQGLVEGAMHASSREFGASIRRVLGGFINQRTTHGVEKMLFKLAEPVIFRSLQVANSNVRQNALHLLLDMFPLEDPDATKEVKDTLLGKQFYILEKLLMDDCPDVRVVAVEGCCRILHLFWEIIPSSSITKIITKILDDISHDICNEVRLSTLNGIIYLLGNPLSHEVLKVLLPRLGHLMQDNVLTVRLAMTDLLLLLCDIRSFQFNKVVSLDVLLSALANDQSQVAQKITRLLIPSYFPSRMNIEEACNRCVTLLKRNSVAGARFCEFAALEGAPLKSLVDLIKVFIDLVLSQDKLGAGQIEGLLVAAAHLCNSISNEPCYRDALKDFCASDTMKKLFAAAPTRRAQSSVFDIVSTLRLDNIAGLLEDCMGLVSDCRRLIEDEERKSQVRSAHKLFLCFQAFDNMFEALTTLMQKVAYRCHIKFDSEISKQSVSSAKRKKSKSSVKMSAKWKYVSGKRSSSFEEDYSTAAGIAWQIKDLLTSEDSRKAILGSQSLEQSFLALKVISEVSIVQSMNCEYMDAYPVVAYTAIALQMTVQNTGMNSTNDSALKKNNRTESSRLISETMLDQAMDHLLNCTDKLFGAADSGKCGKSSNSNHDKSKGARSHTRKVRDEPQMDIDGSVCTSQKISLNNVKILTAILKFIVDSTTLGFASDVQGRCLKFTSAFVRFIVSALGHQSIDKLQIKDEDLGETIQCLKISFGYAAKLINLVLKNSTEAARPIAEAFDLVTDLFDLITSIELRMGSGYAAPLVVAAKPWLPDLILALGSWCIFNRSGAEGMCRTISEHIKLHFRSWFLILSKIGENEMSRVSSEEDDTGVSEPQEFPELKKLMELIISLLKRNQSTFLLDAIGVTLLSGCVVGLERKDYGLVLGLVHFVCVKLVGLDDREWSGLDMMLVSLADIYPLMDREIEEQCDDEDEKQKLNGAKALLEPIWMYHVYETERFSMMEEEMG